LSPWSYLDTITVINASHMLVSFNILLTQLGKATMQRVEFATPVQISEAALFHAF